MNKNLILGVVGVIVISVVIGGYFLMNGSSEEVEINTEEMNEVVYNEFGEFSEFVRSDLSETEKEELRGILTEIENEKEASIKFLTDEFKSKNGEMGEAFITVNESMDTVKSKLSIFLDEGTNFENFWVEKMREMESKYVTK